MAVLAACSESTSPPKPASVAPESAQAADATAGLPLSPSPTFSVKDASGNILGGISVTVTVTAGGGTIADAPAKTIAGSPTPIGTWTLGKTAGVNTVTITVGSLPPATITVNGKPGAPTSIVFVAGLNQAALAGTAVPVAPVAQVRDQFANGVPGVPVTFSVADGDGTVFGIPVTTDASGNAAANSWKLGKSAVPQALKATAGALTVTVSANVASDFDVDLRFYGPPMPDAAAAAFTAAAARVKGSVVGDLIAVNTGTSPLDLEQSCGVTGVSLAAGTIIDDLIIYAAVAPIDGVGKVLAFSGPCFLRNSNGLTVIGVMQFDTDDIQGLINTNRLRDVIQHEMLHVVGIGTLWKSKGLIQGAGTVDSRFTGTLGIGACAGLGGISVCPSSIPVENTGGPGTADGHWREATFGNELMTGFINAGTNPYSNMSVQSMADLGYSVNAASADSYTIPGLAIQQTRSAILAELSPEWEVVMKPKMFISSTGQVTTVPIQ